MPQSRPRSSQVRRYRAIPPTRDSYTHSHGSCVYPTLNPAQIQALLEELRKGIASAADLAFRYKVTVAVVLLLKKDLRRGDAG
jgi:hypothetical protein